MLFAARHCCALRRCVVDYESRHETRLLNPVSEPLPSRILADAGRRTRRLLTHPVTAFVSTRVFLGVLNVFVISIISFVVITLPPGDFVTSYIAQLGASGAIGSEEDVARLRADFGLDQPLVVRYWLWLGDVLQGDLGRSLDWNRPVLDLIGEHMGLTLALTVMALLLSWIIAFPIGICAAMHRNTTVDYVASGLGLVGVAIPNFLLALGVIYIGFTYFGTDFGNLPRPSDPSGERSFAEMIQLAGHLFVPALILAAGSAARLIRVLRANLLDELGKPYVVTARAKGLRELGLVLKYPTRIALNPFVGTIGILLPQLVSGTVIVSMMLNLPTVGPLLLSALQAQDMFLASGILLVLATLTVIGTLISDLLLMRLDPRIRRS
jgi:peptide/nickel transport system permease protein